MEARSSYKPTAAGTSGTSSVLPGHPTAGPTKALCLACMPGPTNFLWPYATHLWKGLAFFILVFPYDPGSNVA